MQIHSIIAFHNHKVPIILKKNSHSVMVNHGKTTKYFPGLINKNSGLLRTFQDSKKNPELFQDVATLNNRLKIYLLVDVSQPFHMKLCDAVDEKNQHHFVIKNITFAMNTFIGTCNIICDTNFCDAITNIYDGMVLKGFNTIAEPHIRRLSVTVGFAFYWGTGQYN